MEAGKFVCLLQQLSVHCGTVQQLSVLLFILPGTTSCCGCCVGFAFVTFLRRETLGLVGVWT